jgi:cytochrome P450
MSWAFYFLAKDPMLRHKLREELEPIMKEAKGVDPPHPKLTHVGLLNAIINETMRIKTSVPSGGPRITPPEGIQVGNTWIPGEVSIFTPHHVIQRGKP